MAKDGDQIYLTMYCDGCRINCTGHIGFYLKGKEYCAECFPIIANAYLAAEKVKEHLKKKKK